MLSSRLVKKMELGLRQMTLGFENQMSTTLVPVFSFIEKEYQTGGPVPLEGIVSSPVLLEDLGAEDILQTVFWLAEELKIHFLVNDRTFPPLQIKKMLMETPDSPVFVVINRLVDESVFARAVETARSLSAPLPDGVDQYAFSRHLAGELKTWRDRLSSWAPRAEQPFFPGKKEIKNGLVLIDRILEKQDSHSMILSCVKYAPRLLHLDETVGVLTEFYLQNLPFWEELIGQMQIFETNLAEIGKEEKNIVKYQRFSEILRSSCPYPLVAEAKQLFKEVQALHQRIERKKLSTFRTEAMAKTDKMIRKLLSLFDTFESAQEYRNACLHELRALNKRIENSTRSQDIQALLNEAKDLFVDVIEEI